MFHGHPKKPSSAMAVSSMCDSGLVLTTDPKPRLRWTAELHERFIEAVTQLGGPDKATPKTIMRVMGVKGLTLYHLKSHLQKFRLGKQPHKDFSDHTIKDASSLELHRSNTASSGILGRSMNDKAHMSDAIRMQMEVNRRLHEHLEVQRHLQLRIEAQGKYMQSMLEKACQTLTGHEATAEEYNKAAMGGEIPMTHHATVQDLNVYACSDQLHHQSSSMDALLAGNEAFCGEKRPNHSGSAGKSRFICDDDFQLQELGTTATASSIDDHRIFPVQGGREIDSVSSMHKDDRCRRPEQVRWFRQD